jgi:hypothetical protein
MTNKQEDNMAKLLTPSEIQEIWLAHFDYEEEPNILKFAGIIEDAVSVLLGYEDELSIEKVIELKRKAGWADERDEKYST